jgi:hypothetical protein
MKNLRKHGICQVVLFAFVLRAAQALYGQIDSVDQQRAVVAKVHVHRQDGHEGYATAIFVGSSPQRAYFITANHLIRKDNVLIAGSVDLQFRSSPDAISATVFDSYIAGADLAVLTIPLTSLPKQLPKLTVIDVKSDTAIHIIGQPAAGDWSVWAGVLQNENATSGDINHFTTSTDPSLAGGFSGGPVFDSPGHFLGMHTETTNSYGVALKATDILRQLTAWNVPHENLATANGDSPVPIVSPNTFPVYIVARHLWIDNNKLGPVTSGTITIAIDDAFSYEANTQDNFEDQRADLTAGQHEVDFSVDLHARNYNRIVHAKGKCIQSLQIKGSSTFEPHIKFDDRGNIVSCGLTPAKH